MRIPTRSHLGFSILTLMACFTAALVLSSCKKTPQQAILGKWNVPADQSVVEFRKDGTLVTTQNGHESTTKYRFIDDTHMELEGAAKAGTNTIMIRLTCTLALHDDTADLTVTLPGKTPGAPAPSQTVHYVRAK